MAGEGSERIGGISVGIGGSDAELEAVLDRAAQRIAAWTQKNGDIKVRVTAADNTRSSTRSQGGSSTTTQQAVPLDTKSLEAKIDQLIGALGRGGGRAASSRSVEAEQVTINGVKVGRLSNLGASLQKAIGPVEVEADTDAVEDKVQNLRVNAAKPIEVNLDISAALGKIEELTGAITGLTQTMAALPTPSAGGGGGRRRRAPQQGTAEPEEEGSEGNQGGRIQIMRQPTISEFEGLGPNGNRGGRIQMLRDAPGVAPIPTQTDIGVVSTPRQRALEREQREQDQQAQRENREQMRRGRRRPRRINARDVGTEADPTRSYFFDPEGEGPLNEAPREEVRRGRAIDAYPRDRTDPGTERLLKLVGMNIGNMAQDAERSAAGTGTGARRRGRVVGESSAPEPTSVALDAGPLTGSLDQSTAATGDLVAATTDLHEVVSSLPTSFASDREAGARQRAQDAEATAENEQAMRATTQTGRVGLTPDNMAPREPRGGAGRAAARLETDAEIEARITRQFIGTEAAEATRGRTVRTSGSAAGGREFGGGRERLLAQRDLNIATAKLVRDEKALRMAQVELQRPAVAADPQRRAEAEVELSEAVSRVTASYERQASAERKLATFTTGGAVLKNIAGVAVAGAALAIGFKAFNFAMAAAVPAAQEWVDVQTGFGATSTRVTSELGKQTLAQRGNVDAVLAAAAAQANLSDSSGQYLDTQLRLTTQIKAAAMAQAASNDLFKAGAGVGNAQTGLFGGFGGVGGSGLFAEQMGGGKGFTESILKGVRGMSRDQEGPDLLGDLNRGLAYLTNDEVQDTVNGALRDQNPAAGQANDIVGAAGRLNPVTGIPLAIGDLMSGKNPVTETADALRTASGDATSFKNSTMSTGATGPSLLDAYLNDLKDAGLRAAEATEGAGIASLEYATSAEEVAQGARMAAAALDVNGFALAKEYDLVLKLNGAVVDSAEAYKEAAELLAQGKSLVDPATLGREALAQERQRQRESAASVEAIQARQAFERPAFLNQLERQQQFQINTQIPAQTALANLAAPPTPVGTGIVGANADEQRKINVETAKTQDLQDVLNTYYEKGRKVLTETYKIPQSLLTNIAGVGQEIASTQAGIANAQATYQVAQFNYQIRISRRTLSDIAGLTGRGDLFGGASSLGILERQNLLLGRQAQGLQFMLSQRQINLQRAVAGFTVPGLTPAEQNARVAEAKIEADFAQKQLDIQKQMFGNQVKIVDISNLRQGMDLAAQISLMLQGRQVTIDTALAQEKLARLQATQAILVEEAGTYLTKTNAAVAGAMNEIQQLEAATGEAISDTMAKGITAAYSVGAAFYAGITGGGAFGSGATKTLGGGGGSGGGTTTRHNATGFFGTVNSATNMVMGEAGSETVAILRNPRNVMGSTGGGGDSVVNFYGDITVRTEADIEEIARKVTMAQGRRASLAGLRSPN